MPVDADGIWSGPRPFYFIPIHAVVLPDAIFAITYDFQSRPIEDPPPQGWGIPRSNVYRDVRAYMQRARFIKDQYSVWQSIQPIDGLTAWVALLLMNRRAFDTPGLLSTIIKGVTLLTRPFPDELAVTHRLTLGGDMNPFVAGPTPRALCNRPGVHAHNLQPVPIDWPGDNNRMIPRGVPHSDEALDWRNWWMYQPPPF